MNIDRNDEPMTVFKQGYLLTENKNCNKLQEKMIWLPMLIGIRFLAKQKGAKDSYFVCLLITI